LLPRLRGTTKDLSGTASASAGIRTVHKPNPVPQLYRDTKPLDSYLFMATLIMQLNPDITPLIMQLNPDIAPLIMQLNPDIAPLIPHRNLRRYGEDIDKSKYCKTGNFCSDFHGR
jgi:hypothetical protein